MDQFTEAYIEAMLWSTSLPPYGECPGCGETRVLDRWRDYGEHVCNDCSDREPNYEPAADDNYGVCDISPDLMELILKDCAKFQDENDISERGESQAGHDFWLTREGHGCGFWDGDWPITGDILTKASEAYGEMYLYVGDDGKIYGS